MLTVRQIFGLGEAIAPRYRALVLLATFTSLRWESCAHYGEGTLISIPGRSASSAH